MKLNPLVFNWTVYYLLLGAGAPVFVKSTGHKLITTCSGLYFLMIDFKDVCLEVSLLFCSVCQTKDLNEWRDRCVRAVKFTSTGRENPEKIISEEETYITDVCAAAVVVWRHVLPQCIAASIICWQFPNAPDRLHYSGENPPNLSIHRETHIQKGKDLFQSRIVLWKTSSCPYIPAPSPQHQYSPRERQRGPWHCLAQVTLQLTPTGKWTAAKWNKMPCLRTNYSVQESNLAPVNPTH